jgi:hypothetical protein
MTVTRSINRAGSWILALLVVIGAAAFCFGVRWYHSEQACERRGAALDARIQRIKSEAQYRIQIGTRKEDVYRFLEENGPNASFSKNSTPGRIVGTGTDAGCPHIFGCGDAAIIQVQIDVDGSGNAISPPKVDSGYTDCM